MSFFQDLWQSIFEPGTSPQLLIATHLSFASLILVLAWLSYATRNVHFFALLAIASILWGLVTWFVNELQQANLRDNDELAQAQEEEFENQRKIKKNKKRTKAREEQGHKFLAQLVPMYLLAAFVHGRPSSY
ncbi:related to V-type ATPase assembly factor PKR1 [Zygosaccharomyces bailii ISA1307]|nr:related to V-type ATPase assembly factor PKR1 [Zygosaccharomyces bailii ISA1307]